MILKKVFIALLVTAALASCNNAKKDAAENAGAPTDSIYGEKIDDKGAITMAELIKQMEGKTELENVKVSAKISEVCQEMGCWMRVDKGDSCPTANTNCPSRLFPLTAQKRAMRV